MPCLILDSSVLASLSGAGVLARLQDLYCPVYVPEGVRFEVVERGCGWKEVKLAQQAILDGDWLITRPCENLEFVAQLRKRLDRGESEVIALALETGCLAAIDEKKGRQVAGLSGLRPIGSFGLLLQMKKVGVIPAVKPCIDWMTDNGFRCSLEIVRRVLREANE